MKKKTDRFRTMLQVVPVIMGLAVGSIALIGCVGGDRKNPFGPDGLNDDDDNDDNNDNDDDNDNDDEDNSDNDEDDSGSDQIDGDDDSDGTDSDTGTDTDSDTDTDTETDTDSDADTDALDQDAEFCHPTAQNWPAAWALWEEEVLTLTNQARSIARSCGAEGSFQAVAPLTMNSKLRCAARVHAYDMSANGYLSHDSPGGPIGDDVEERIESAGYTNWTAIGENIAQGQKSPVEVVQAWLGSDGHCANIMSSAFKEIGIGYANAATPDLWVQDFGASF